MSWEESNNALVHHYHFRDFQECFGFATKVALLAEKQQHHPDMEISYNKLTLRLCTHDQGKIITEKDRELARMIDKL